MMMWDGSIRMTKVCRLTASQCCGVLQDCWMPVAPMALDGDDYCQVLEVMHPVDCFSLACQDC